jgi:DNA (cytosine-5)-methyltransferase 1
MDAYPTLARPTDVGVMHPPDFPRQKPPLPTIVSLFAGAGGLDLGFKQGGFKVGIAFDISPAAVQTHRRNFRRSKAVAADLNALGPAGVLREVLSVVPVGTKIGIIGGPLCQGFSRANVRREASDPRNELPELYLKIIRELQKGYDVQFVVFENVLGIRDFKHEPTYRSLVSGLRRAGFHVAEQELCATDFGVPQTRKRIFLAALSKSLGPFDFRPRRRNGSRCVKDAIFGLPEPCLFSRGLDPRDFPLHPNHWTMNPKSPRFIRGTPEQSSRCFKRLEWDKPSPTIAFGHREIHVHPSGVRRLSIFEAMLLQGFPKKFVLKGNLSDQVEQISNAVPPPLARSVAAAIKRCLQKAVAR